MAKRTAASKDDPGQYLPLLARSAADRVKPPKETLSRSAALAAAPWSPEMPAAWERAFRAAYADRLEARGFALPAKRSGSTSGTRGTATKLDRRLLSQTTAEFIDQDGRAATEGLPWSTWARRKLAT